MYAKDDSQSALVLVLGRPADPVAAKVAARLRGSFEVMSAAVESHAELRETVEPHRARLGALVVGAADGAAASTLVWDLDRAMRWLAERTVVVVNDLATLDAVPARLRSALPYRAVSEGALEQLAELLELLMDRPRERDEIDVLASLVRSAVERRSVDSLPPLLGDWSSADTLAPEQLALAHVGDQGQQPNPLWAHWSRQRDGAAIERLAARLVAHERRLAQANSEPWHEQEPPEPASKRSGAAGLMGMFSKSKNKRGPQQ